uniref:Transposon protein, putative, unclassified n=2 Tax=Oryza sativa subsp. japonica TaxID=39947 RepID=Q8LMX2_ORYSJ|nr:hypothetical protein [Oryza sativa Japonica Group]AAP52570.1 transposon protein, putative, unclassified [Oryza sativa Japonica Group]
MAWSFKEKIYLPCDKNEPLTNHVRVQGLDGPQTEPQTKPYPLDMWKYGSALQQRPELNPYSGRGATSHN